MNFNEWKYKWTFELYTGYLFEGFFFMNLLVELFI